MFFSVMVVLDAGVDVLVLLPLVRPCLAIKAAVVAAALSSVHLLSV